MHLCTIIIPAAGQGTRLLLATKAVPKVVLTVYQSPVLQFALDKAVDAARIIVVIHPNKLAIRYDLRPDDGQIRRLGACGKATLRDGLAAVQLPETVDLVFAMQDQPLGLRHAVSCHRDLVLSEPIGVINKTTRRRQACAGDHRATARTVRPQDASCSGIFRRAGADTGPSVAMSNMVEKPVARPEPSAAVGRYILDPLIFSALIPRGAGGEIQLTDAIVGLGLTAFRGADQRFDCGNHDGSLAPGLARQRAVKGTWDVAARRSAAFEGTAS